jgi:alpha-glucuronidase
MKQFLRLASLCALAALVAAAGLHAENGHDAWLRYAPLDAARAAQDRQALPAVVVTLGQSPVVDSARDELIRGVRGMLGVTLREESSIPTTEGAIVLEAIGNVRSAALFGPGAGPGSYLVETRREREHRYLDVFANDDRGVLYGVFALLRRMALGGSLEHLSLVRSPYAPVRWVNHWDNLDGSIERGYGGRSIFWDQGHVRQDLSRVSDYGRLLASLGINGCSINNVNADPRLLKREYSPEIARIADAFRPWGVQVVLAVDLASPKTVGGLDTFDPLDPNVAAWWKSRVDELYEGVPDLGGFVLKAASEGRAGPAAYGRTHADAANMLAHALRPHGGLLCYRGFVYDNHMDWRNLKNDRAKAAYDNFMPLDGQFDSNVLIQIKNGPIDFQVREPASPLFGALEKTNQAIELQVTQEYTGQARHLVYLVPMWKATLDFDMHAKGAGTPVKALVAGKTFHRPEGGFIGVANVGLDDDWTGNQLSQANLYGFGRLAWNPDLSSQQIADEWTRLTFGSDPKVLSTIPAMLLKSWRVYEDYTGPLGLQTLTDIVGNHYGVSVEASERNGWGQWHRADEHGVGMDRTVATGTGFIGQYRPAIAEMYESLATCPDDLLLFMHHVPYTYVLHSGKTVIQTIYDLHYEGAEAAAAYVLQWESLKGYLDDQRYAEVHAQLKYQAGQAVVWRDAVTNWFMRESGIPDAQGRVGHYPGRVEAEAMKLDGYTVTDVKPWEAASGGKAIACPAAKCSARFRFDGKPGWYTLRVEYFDQNNGESHFRLLVGSQAVDQWIADLHLPTLKLDGTSSTRREVSGVALRPGDEIRVEGAPDGHEAAAVDYIEILPSR